MALVALSYDEPDALADFAASSGITYPLLSDPDSEIIQRLGILNTLIAPDDHPWFGIPFPGSYVLAADGRVTAKFFEANLAVRIGAPQLLRAALGEHVDVEEVAAEPPASVEVEVRFDGPSLTAVVLHELVVTLRVPAGQHLYGQPVPEGMVATTVEIDELEGLVTRPPRFPPTRPHTLAGTGEVLHVVDGDVELRVPISHTGRSAIASPDGPSEVVVAGTVRWQACDDDVCHLPASERFELTLLATRPPRPPREPIDGVPWMDQAAHLNRMVERRG